MPKKVKSFTYLGCEIKKDGKTRNEVGISIVKAGSAIWTLNKVLLLSKHNALYEAQAFQQHNSTTFDLRMQVVKGTEGSIKPDEKI